jgi:ornithine cyclodeaminase/alanine dehydrogenase-like protein (mu-crystallin family)
MIHITEEQVRALLPMAKAIELVEEAFRRLAQGQAVNHPRRRIVLLNRTVLHYMAAGDSESGYLGTKVYATNPRHGARFVVLLFDAETTALLATIDADALGQIRTGAASGVATRHMARADARILAQIGAGYQAETQLEAVAAVREITQVRVYSRSEERRGGFAERMAATLGLPVRPVATAEEAVRDADIVTTITSARDPVIDANWLRSGAHINAAGSNHILRREIPAAAIERAAVIAVDSIEQAQLEAGDLVAAAKEGRLEGSRGRDLAEVVGGKANGRPSTDAITLFESQGLAIEDIAVAGYVYRRVTGQQM